VNAEVSVFVDYERLLEFGVVRYIDHESNERFNHCQLGHRAATQQNCAAQICGSSLEEHERLGLVRVIQREVVDVESRAKAKLWLVYLFF
jgi:hypothetical protein